MNGRIDGGRQRDYGATVAMTISPASGSFGVDVTGVDLRAPTEAMVAELRTLLDEYYVLFLPDQELDDASHMALAQMLGEPYIHPLGRANGATSARVEHIIDSPEQPPYQDQWHTDVSWDQQPPTYGTLRAIEMPPRGGDTIWVDMYAVFASLSPRVQALLEPLHAWHGMGSMTAFISKAGAEVVARTREQFPPTRHPVAPIHPATGRRYLYVNRGFTENIEELTEGESRALLGHLTELVTNPNFQTRHRWRVGDVAIWDERCTQHFAVADYMPHRREMARVPVTVRDPSAAKVAA